MTQFTTTKSRSIATAFCMSVLMFQHASYAQDSPQPATQARAMTAYELYVLYRDKSWQWTDGAGRMDTDGRRFTAISGSGRAASWAEGQWVITDRGRMCLDADWHSSTGVFPDRTCFDHRLDGQTIYQRRLPGGDWYVFKHTPAESDDEFTKLVRKDLISAGLKKAQAATRPQLRSTKPSNSGADYND